MGRFFGKSIQRRLALLVLVAIGMTMSITVVFSAWWEAARYADQRRAELTATAQLFAAIFADPLSVMDEQSALRALRASSQMPHVAYIGVRDRFERPFAEMGIRPSLEGRTKGGGSPLMLLLGQGVQVEVPIVKSALTIGAVHISASTADLRERVLSGMLSTAFAGALAVLIALFFATRLRKSICEPMLALAAAMSSINESQSYSRTLRRLSDDETGTLTDAFNKMVSEVRSREARIVRYTEDLEQEAEARTNDLAMAKAAAERASTAKSDILATLGHDVRTPVTGMLVLADRLAASRLDGRARRFAQVIKRSSHGLLASLNDTLDLAKIESGRLNVETAPFDPVECIDDVIALFHQRAADKGLLLSAIVKPNVPARIAGDPIRFTQVVSNLVNNALKGTDTGHVLVTIERLDQMRGATAQVTLRIAVEDTGIGIAADKLDGLFDGFAPADQSTSRGYGGTGLGMAILRQSVEAMGGTVGVNSRLGEGSTFAFTVRAPLVEAARRDDHDSGRLVLALAQSVETQLLEARLTVSGRRVLRISPSELTTARLDATDLVIAEPTALDVVSDRYVNAGSRPRRAALVDLSDPSADDLISADRADTLLVRPIHARSLAEALAGNPAPLGAHSAPAITEAATSIQQAGPSEPTGRFAGTEVLVADDNAVNREVIAETLKRLGVTATIVPDGRAAVEIAFSRPFALILMDGAMPKLDGYQATRLIRDQERARGRGRIPIVALTPQAADGTNDWREPGMDDAIAKPFTLDTLARVIGKWSTAEPATRSAVPADPRSRAEVPPVASTAARAEPTGEILAPPSSAPIALPAPALKSAQDVAGTPNRAPAAAPPPVATAPTAGPPLPAQSKPIALSTNDLPILDEKVIGNLRAIDAEAGGGLIARVAKLYLGHGPAVIERLAEVARGEDRNGLADAAHAVKSMSLNVGVSRVAHLATTIEQAARAGQTGAFLDEIAALRIAYDEAAAELRAMIPPPTKTAASA